jgi:biotin carboxylase
MSKLFGYPERYLTIKQMGKKILVLAGSNFQIPVIEYAKRLGHYVITCDNKPENPGHKLADEYINISTTDYKKILKIAQEQRIDGILAYGSDPAALTAAYVSKNLNLPGNNFECVRKLSDKGLFRKFLSDNKFPAPKYQVYRSLDEAYKYTEIFENAIFIKPVDSSGSKGISKLSSPADPENAFNFALKFSRKGEVIFEEEIMRKGPHIHGEAFVYNGELKFLLLGDQYFSRTNICAPCSTTLPSIEHSDIMQSVTQELSRLLKLIQFKTGGLNIEIIRDQADQIFFVEIGARNGGNLMPELAMMASGFNVAAANVNSSLGEEIDFDFVYPDKMYFTQVILGSHDNGKFDRINIPETFRVNLKKELIYCVRGDNVSIYKSSQDVLGVLLFSFENIYTCNDFMFFLNHNDTIILN